MSISRKDIKILFFGTPEISAYVLEKMLENKYNVIGVVAQEDKPVGRKNIIEPVPTKVVANKYNIPTYQFKKVREHYQELKELNPDLILTLSYGQIISHDILTIPKYGCLNLHGSILPKYRGAAPIQYALLNGDKETGVTLMEMVDKMDAGKMYAIKKFPLTLDDNYDSTVAKMEQVCFEIIEENLDKYLNNELKGEEQNEELVTFTKKILPEDEIITFDKTSDEIVNKVRALSTHPGAYFVFNNIKYKILKAEKIDDSSSLTSGTILAFNKKELLIKTKDGVIKVLLIQKQGKKVMGISDFYNGNSKDFEVNKVI